MEDVEREINPNFENQLKIEKTLEKYNSMIKPQSFDKINSIGEMLSYLIYDAGCHYGLIKYKPNILIKEDNRMSYLNEKRKYFSEITK